MPAGEDQPATLQTRLETDAAGAGKGRNRAGPPTVADPAALLQRLDDSGHFHRDSRAGRVYHPGMVSLREDVPVDSLHVSVDDNRVMAHVDEASPLAARSEGRSRYSVVRATAHNLAGIAHDVLTLVRGRQGDHTCKLDCEWVSREAGGAPRIVPLLDPTTSAWGVQLDVRLSGRLDEARLRAALDTIVGVRGGGDCLTVVDCDDDEGLDAARRRLHGADVPLTVLPPFHVHLAHHSAGDVLMLNLNHAAVDGFGALRLLERLARSYAGDGPPQDALDFLACADLPVQPTAPTPPRLVRLGRAVLERLRDALSKPPRLAAEEADGDAGYGFHLVGLSAQATRDVSRRGGGVGEVLIAALHLTIAEWNRRHQLRGRRIGVLVPVDLRPDDLPDHVVANLSVNTRLSTTPRERATPGAALRAICWQVERDEGTRTGIALIAALERAGMLALWAKQSTIVLQPLIDNGRADAAMVCDLGSLACAPSFGPGAGQVRELWFSPPSRSPRCLCVGAVTVEGRLHLTFRYPHRLFGPDAVRRFADLYVAQLELVGGTTS
ncbi:MAG: hypothetical protein KY463_03005 [Actinobacteria bacterium]|nr:hypothetical protein [Actinomycetota bacterium]